ncbi:hypothetical protein IWZ01DRAFT_481439 [Phyllosticta capitalensis]
MGAKERARKRLRRMKGSVAALHSNNAQNEGISYAHNTGPNGYRCRISHTQDSASTQFPDTKLDSKDDAPLLPHERMSPPVRSTTIKPSDSSASLPDIPSASSHSKSRENEQDTKDSDSDSNDVVQQPISSTAPMPQMITTGPEPRPATTTNHCRSRVDKQVAHPRNRIFQDAHVNIRGGFFIHAWKKWECCHCGSYTHYERHVCSCLECCHTRCEASCTTLEPSDG